MRRSAVKENSMEFIKYRSIENDFHQEFITEIVEQGLSSGEWIVQEKVHGANFSFWINKDEIRVANRNKFLEENNTPFFEGYKIVYTENVEKIKCLYELVGGAEVRVFGELFGGIYNHEEVKRIPEASKIQSGIHYAPFNAFYGFDVVVDGTYLSVDEVNDLFSKAGLFYAKPLFRGTFEKCLKYPNDFPSNIPKWLGLPDIEGNICEGIIVRPAVTKYLADKGEVTGSRVIIKSKNAIWEERAKKEKREGVKLTEEGQGLFEELCTFVTLNRLENVVSKIGNVEPKDFGKLMGLLNKDVLEEFNKAYGQQFGGLEKSEQKYIRKLLGPETSKLVKTYFDEKK